MKMPAIGMALLLATTACASAEPRIFPDAPRIVPDLTGRSLETARDLLEDQGLIVEVETDRRRPARATDCPAAEVVGQDVPAGDAAVAGTIVTLTVHGC